MENNQMPKEGNQSEFGSRDPNSSQERNAPGEATGETSTHTNTGYNVSASNDTNNIADENYGATGNKTWKDIQRELYHDESDE